MPHLRIIEVAHLLGVSDDTVRRWVADGRLPASDGPGGATVVEGAAAAALAQEIARTPPTGARGRPSARNRLTGLVTRVVVDGVMAQVELQAGPFRLVSLVSREAVEELGLEVGSRATAVVKATDVGLEVPA
ncbi:TOBE domain-containing protein [Aquipuribacter nitratireducens]|uniref:Molybdopterin-binding protein n=1 Tax=Aquipuribacter nitratireducens TaxID=650104 RepID=A0ABW0GM99_9MICO